MFTGIVECLGKVTNVVRDQTNMILTVESRISSELKIDQSVAHNGACLTVVEIKNNSHTVVLIDETLKKTNFAAIQIGDLVNLERCLPMNGRLDGHMVQGHVDTVATCIQKKSQQGSWIFTFQHPENEQFMTVEKGSICVNGISLTVVNAQKNEFSVAIIPYTYENTSIQFVEVGSKINLEFDIIGKYISKFALNYK
jgi:riboflavin synthase